MNGGRAMGRSLRVAGFGVAVLATGAIAARAQES